MRVGNKSKLLARLGIAWLILVLSVTPALAQKRFILRANGGLSVVQTLCRMIGCDILQGLGDPAAKVFLIRTGNPSLLTTLLALLGIAHVEPDLLTNLVPSLRLITPATQAPPGLVDSAPVPFAGATVWNGYASQPAAGVVRAAQARSSFGVNGAGVIGIVDTGVDPDHPALAPVLVRGFDFTRNRAGASELADLNQSTAAVVDGSPVMVCPTTVSGSRTNTTPAPHVARSDLAHST